MKKIFLLGAGFSHAVLQGNIPLTNDLFDLLKIGEIDELKNLYKLSHPDIEHFFSLLDLQIIKEAQKNSNNNTLDELRNKLFNNTIKLLEPSEAQFNKLKDLPLLNNFIKNVQKESVILTLNYDTIIERGLWLAKKWSPNGGYYLSVYPHESSKLNKELENIILLKLHGSLNFRLERPDLLSHLGYGPNKHNIYIEISDNYFPNINSRTNTQAGTNSFYNNSPYIMIMSYLKIFNNELFSLWRKALQEVQNSDNITIIGSSLREEDTFLRFLISNLGLNFLDIKKTIEIVDRDEDSCEKIYHRIIAEFLVPHSPIPRTKFYYGLDKYLSGVPNRIKDD